MKKPLGIKLIIILNLLGAIVTSIVGGIMISTYQVFGGSQYLLITALVICLVLIYLIGVYGLWSVKRWGPTFVKYFYVLGAIFSIYIIVKPILGGEKIDIGVLFENIIGILLCLSIFKYLSRKSIKKMYNVS